MVATESGLGLRFGVGLAGLLGLLGSKCIHVVLLRLLGLEGGGTWTSRRRRQIQQTCRDYSSYY
jgi:hypothetical protein